MVIRDYETRRRIILNLVARRKQVVYGGQSVNHNLPPHLRKPTVDYDILTHQPKKAADELVLNLNKEYGKEKYNVIEAQHKGTFKVKDIETGENVADYTLRKKLPRVQNSFGVRYTTLKQQERDMNKSLKDENSLFRREKDTETLKRIKEGRKPIWL